MMTGERWARSESRGRYVSEWHTARWRCQRPERDMFRLIMWNMGLSLHSIISAYLGFDQLVWVSRSKLLTNTGFSIAIMHISFKYASTILTKYRYFNSEV